MSRNEDPDFKCVPVTDKEYRQHYERSIKCHKQKTKRLQNNEKYEAREHKDWCDKHNLGITHYGINPNHLPISSIRYDVMHMSMALTRSTITYTRQFVMSQEQVFIDTFNNHLRTFW